MEGVNDIRITHGLGVKFGPGGSGQVGSTFNVDTTCNDQVNPLTGERIGDGQCWGIVANTPEDRAAALEYQRIQREKHSVGNYLEEIGSGIANSVKNLAAGVVNSVVPGSDLGDSDNLFRTIGEIGGAIIGPTAIIGAVGKIGIVAKGIKVVENVSVFGSIAKAVGQIGSSPIVNTIVGGVVASITAPKQQPAYTTGQVLPTQQAANPYMTPLVVSTPQGTINTGNASAAIPTWLLPVGIGVAVIVLIISLFKRPVRK